MSDPIADILAAANAKSKMDDVIDNKQAPAHTGKPVFEKDFEMLASLGVKGYENVFGKKIANEDSKEVSLPLNFGLKSSTGMLPDDVRLRLYGLKKAISNAEIQAGIMFKTAHVSPAMIMETPIFKNQLQGMLKAYNVTDFSTFLQTVNARFYFEEVELPYLLGSQFDQLPMDATTMNITGVLGFLEGFEETDVATFSEQSATQSNYVVTARNNVVHSKISEDLLSDSAPAFMEIYRKKVLEGTVRAFEKTIINGDTTVLTSARGDGHMDTDTRALALNATFQKAFDGMRKKAKVNDTALLAASKTGVIYDNGGDSVSKTTFATMLEMMGHLNTQKDDLIYVVPSEVETKLVTGAIPELFTAFAFGGLASNVTGQCPPVFGVKVVSSPFVRTDLNASGVYAAASNLTQMLLIKRSRFNNFVRQATRVWAAPSLPNSDMMLMTAKTRHSWNGNPQSDKERGITMAINIAK